MNDYFAVFDGTRVPVFILLDGIAYVISPALVDTTDRSHIAGVVGVSSALVYEFVELNLLTNLNPQGIALLHASEPMSVLFVPSCARVIFAAVIDASFVGETQVAVFVENTRNGVAVAVLPFDRTDLEIFVKSVELQSSCND
uniref:CheW-like domain-containing protein n=1 Tax=Romanomermis culicivorax TaxID=13658 RepID=A0A915HQY5_ROMCU